MSGEEWLSVYTSRLRHVDRSTADWQKIRGAVKVRLVRDPSGRHVIPIVSSSWQLLGPFFGSVPAAEELTADIRWLERRAKLTAAPDDAAAAPANKVVAGNMHDGGGSGSSSDEETASIVPSLAQTAPPALQQQPQSDDRTPPPTAPSQLDVAASRAAGGRLRLSHVEGAGDDTGNGSGKLGAGPEDTETKGGGAAGVACKGGRTEDQGKTKLKRREEGPGGRAWNGAVIDNSDSASRQADRGRGRGETNTRGGKRGRGGRAAGASRKACLPRQKTIKGRTFAAEHGATHSPAPGRDQLLESVEWSQTIEQTQSRDQATVKRTKRPRPKAKAQPNAETAEQREAEEMAAKHRTMMRRNRVAFYTEGRPALAKAKRSKTPSPPIIPQDLYRNALKKMTELDEPFPPPGQQGQADDSPSPAAAVTQSSQQPGDHQFYHEVGGAEAERHQPQDFTKTQASSPMIPVGFTAPGLVEWQQNTTETLHGGGALPASTDGVPYTLWLGNAVPGGQWEESTGRGGTGKFGVLAEVVRKAASSKATVVAAAAVPHEPQRGVDPVVSVATHAPQILKPITVEGELELEREREHERQQEQEQEQERFLGGSETTAGAPLKLGDDREQSPSLAGKGFAGQRHSLHDLRGGSTTGGVDGVMLKRRSPSGDKGPRGPGKGVVGGEISAGVGLQGSTSAVTKRGRSGVDETKMEPSASAEPSAKHTATAAASGKGAKVRDREEDNKTAANASVSRVPTGKRGRGPREDNPEGGRKGRTKRSRANYEISDQNKKGTREEVFGGGVPV